MARQPLICCFCCYMFIQFAVLKAFVPLLRWCAPAHRALQSQLPGSLQSTPW